LTTRSTEGMSRPREATSVATRMGHARALNLPRAPRRCFCDLFECRAAACSPSSASVSSRSWQLRVVPVKMMQLRTPNSSSLPKRCSR